MENKKSGLITGMIIGFLIAAIAGGAVYFLMDSKDKKNDDKKQSSETKKDESKKKEETKDLSDVTFDLNNFDSSKIINKKNDTIIYINNDNSRVYEALSKLEYNNELSNYAIWTKYDYNKNTATILVNWEELKSFNNESAKAYEYTVSNFEGKIRKVYVGGWGQAIGNETIFYLMKDGTVEYTSIDSNVVNEALKDPDNFSLKSSGKVDGVEDIVMIARIGVGSTETPVGGYGTTIAIKADGSFYDLYEILK